MTTIEQKNQNEFKCSSCRKLFCSQDTVDMTKFVENTKSRFSKFYDDESKHSFLNAINECKTFFLPSKPNNDILGSVLVSEKGYNAFKMYEMQFLSKNGRLKLKPGYLKGIHVSCVNMKDIKAVTLLIKVSTEQELTQKLIDSVNDAIDFQGLSIYDKPTKQYYYEVKRIEKPSSNYIEFFKVPMYLPDDSYSIVVEFNDESIRKNTENMAVELHLLALSNSLHKRYKQDWQTHFCGWQ